MSEKRGARDPSEIEQLKQAIAVLEAQRAVLGDSVLEITLASLREKLAALAPKPENQRRMITALFADLQEFTSVAEKLDVEEVSALLSQVWERVDARIVQRGGLIESHMGDGLLAIWGLEAIHEDDPEQAVRAALAIRDSLAEQPIYPIRQPNSPLAMRIGVHTGIIMVNPNRVSLDASLAGDTLNLASRLQRAAKPGSLLISHATYRLVRGLFTVIPLAPMHIKGKVDPVQTYQVVEAKPRAFPIETRSVEGVETPFVGREAEMQALQDEYRKMIDGSQPRLVTVVGEAGLGKSRLLYEFMTWAELQPELLWSFSGRASLSTQQAPYSFLHQILAWRCKIQDNDSLAVAHAKYEQEMQVVLGDYQADEKQVQILGHLIGLNYTTSPHLRGLLAEPSQFNREALLCLKGFFNHVASRGPVVLLLDDLHWADTASLEALQAVLEGLGASSPVLCIGMARPALFERYPWPSGTRLDLRPLTSRDCNRLVREILAHVSDLPAVLQELIVGRAEGNPFYLEELIKMLIDTGVIQTQGEQWQVIPERLVRAQVPPSLVEVLQARLDELQPGELVVLQQAAVIGRTFWDAALACIASETAAPAGLGAALSTLERKELIYHSNQPPAFAGGSEYTFKHAILQEVTYETVLKRQRPVYHARAARWLEQVSGENNGQYAALIADHYEKAGMPAKAAEAMLRAGLRAVDLSINRDARGFFERGLKMAEPGSPVQAQLELGLAEVLSIMADYPLALGHGQAAFELANHLGMLSQAADALTLLGRVHTDQGDYDQAERLLNQALPLANAGQAESTNARLLAGLAYVCARRGNWREAGRYYALCLEKARLAGDLHREIAALNGLGIVKRMTGDSPGGERYFREATQFAMQHELSDLAMVALNNLGSLASERGDLPAALDYFQQCLGQALKSGQPMRAALSQANLGETYLKMNNLPAARVSLTAALASARQLGTQPLMLGCLVYICRLYFMEGKVSYALALLGCIRRHPSTDGDTQHEIDTLLREWGLSEEQVEQGMRASEGLEWESLVEL